MSLKSILAKQRALDAQRAQSAQNVANWSPNLPAVPVQDPNRQMYQPPQLPTQGGGGIQPVQPVQVNNAALRRLFSPQAQSAPTAGMTEVSKALRAGPVSSEGE